MLVRKIRVKKRDKAEKQARNRWKKKQKQKETKYDEMSERDFAAMLAKYSKSPLFSSNSSETVSYARHHQDFAVKLLTHLGHGDNIVYSPYVVGMAFALLLAGSDGNSREVGGQDGLI